jgi:hypothetical protein
MGYRVSSTLSLTALACLITATAAIAKPKPLNRSLYLPVEFILCEHLDHAVLYQDDTPISSMPAKRVFQFTYYPDLAQMLPAVVQVRVEGTYADDGEQFVAKLAVTPTGVHTTHRTMDVETGKSVQKQQSHKIDIRLEPRLFRLACPRYCRKANSAAPEEP